MTGNLDILLTSLSHFCQIQHTNETMMPVVYDTMTYVPIILFYHFLIHYAILQKYTDRYLTSMKPITLKTAGCFKGMMLLSQKMKKYKK